MSLKRSDKSANGNSAPATDAAGDIPKYRDNVEINAKIDTYIQANPKEWAYIQGLPRERLERMLVLQNVNKIERRARLSAGYLSKPRVSAALLPTRPTEKNIIASNRRRVHGEMCYRKECFSLRRGPRQIWSSNLGLPASPGVW